MLFVKNREKDTAFKLCERISNNWQRVGRTLGLSIEKLTSIRRHFRTDEVRMEEVLKLWFDNACQLPNRYHYPLSWDGLYQLLKDSGHGEVAKQYFEFLDAMPPSEQEPSILHCPQQASREENQSHFIRWIFAFILISAVCLFICLVTFVSQLMAFQSQAHTL